MPSQNQRALGRRQGLSVQPSHTNKLQDLYNNWRDAEDSEKLETYLRLGPEGLGNQEEGGSQGDGAAVPRQDVAKRRRTGRYTAVQLAKGAFKRALGACVGCHKRKVEVSIGLLD